MCDVKLQGFLGWFVLWNFSSSEEVAGSSVQVASP